MKLIADLHLHSKYSRAVSQQMIIPEIAKWAKKKGINLVGAPDWTHPLQLRELKENLVETAEGIFSARTEPKINFLLATEISSIYSQGGKTRRIHNLMIVPSFKTVEKINNALRQRGANLMSDGRPIIGLSSQELAELVFTADKNCLIIPCHIWTPWFSLFGSQSGFDSLKECFGEFSDQIIGIETGLSSSPDMNWRIKELDSRAILSFSDAHSPAKLGREAVVFDMGETKPSYQAIKKAIQDQKIVSTIEFYPEEGKYHYTGHRNCQIRHSPEETKKLGATCSVCGRGLTVGVMHRVEELASRPIGYQAKNRPPYRMLVPLLEVLSEALEVGPTSQTVRREYDRLISNFGSEFMILIKSPLEEIGRLAGERVSEAIKRVREGEIVVEPGYDGVFGVVKIWPPEKEKKQSKKEQMSLF